LAGVYAKLNRGFDHLEELQRDTVTFFASHPYSVVDTRDPDTRWHSVIYRVHADPPLELGVIAGDALNQFRGALDHLLTEAARLRKPSTRSVNFPASLTPNEFTGAPANGRRSIEAVLRANLRPEHLAIVKRHQPFEQARGESPRSMPLAALAHLNNVDKHEVVHVAYGTPRTSGIADVEDAVFLRPEVIEDGTEYCRYLPFESQVEVKAVISMELAFGRDSIYRQVTWGSLHMIGAWVGQVVEEFRRVTPEFGLSPYINHGPLSPTEAEMARRSDVGKTARRLGRPYYSTDAKRARYHTLSDCPVGRRIPERAIRAGSGTPPLCSVCERAAPPVDQLVTRPDVDGRAFERHQRQSRHTARGTR
jgi:hypothetical protein